jgi:hypothetical protein
MNTPTFIKLTSSYSGHYVLYVNINTIEGITKHDLLEETVIHIKNKEATYHCEESIEEVYQKIEEAVLKQFPLITINPPSPATEEVTRNDLIDLED